MTGGQTVPDRGGKFGLACAEKTTTRPGTSGEKPPGADETWWAPLIRPEVLHEAGWLLARRMDVFDLRVGYVFKGNRWRF